MADEAPLTYQTPDWLGFTPEPAWVGNRLVHSGNGKTYRITGFAWMGATDVWGFLHVEDGVGLGAVVLCRPLSHRDGKRDNGDKRYTVLA